MEAAQIEKNTSDLVIVLHGRETSACEDQFKLQIHWQRRIRLSESPYLFGNAETSLFPIWDKKLIWAPKY
jgi:hypothetical protein